MNQAIRCVAIAALLALYPTNALAADPDPWFGKDKALHFSVSAAIAAGGYTVGAAAFDARSHALLLGGGLALAAGVGKEVLDLTGSGDPSWKDLTWDAIGIVTGLALAWSVDLLVRGVGDAHPALSSPHAKSSSIPTGIRVVF